MTKFLNVDLDTNLQGENASDNLVSSQKAVKTYVDKNLAEKQDNLTIYNAGFGIDIEGKYDLPSGYTQLDYVKNTANSTRLDLGFSPLDGDVIEVIFQVKKLAISNYFVQARASSSTSIYGISGAQSGDTIAATFSGASAGSSIKRKLDHKYYIKASFIAGTITLYVKDITTNEENTVTASYTFTSISSNYYLWGNAVQLLNAQQPVQYLKISNGNTVRLEYIPATDNTHIGFYNTVTNSFTYNNSLTAGNTFDKTIIRAPALNNYQPLLVSGTNIKTINSTSLLGSGDISITGLPSQTSQSGRFLTTDGTNASWSNVPSTLPSQSGNSGKYLTTDGTDASWGDTAQASTITLATVATTGDYDDLIDKPNLATVATTGAFSDLSGTSNVLQNIGTSEYSVAILEGNANQKYATAYGSNAQATGVSSLAIGGGGPKPGYATASGKGAIAIGSSIQQGSEGISARAVADYAIQIGCGYNNETKTLKVMLGENGATDNYTLLNATGNIPSDRLASSGSTGQVLTKTASGQEWANAQDTTYTSGTGITIGSGNAINHSNSITAGTAGTSSATSGSTLAVPYVTYDAQGHITAKGTHTHTVTGFLTQSDVTSTYSATGTAPLNGTAVKSALDAAISSVYKPAGSVTFANKPSLSSSVEGNVYNITDAFTTTSDFVEGAGNSYPAGTNIVCINTATSGQTAVYKWDVLAGFVDLSGYQTLIDSSHKLNADLVDDTSTTNKFVTASDKTTWSGKQDAITGGASSITSSNLTANRTLISNSSGKVVASSVTNTELGYVSGVTSAIQTQLNNKITANATITGATKCKITYDSKGLVTSGTDLQASDIPDISSTYQTVLVSGTNIKTINNNSILGSGNLAIDSLPSQSGQSGKYLTTNGTSASWATIDALPSQSGNSGKFLSTNGTTASWTAIEEYTANEVETLWNSITPST